ncbi:MAG: hypothetical protein ABIS50_24650 [Luteolibacter sp.]|uniref:hypothetical protein n=1 Tax=Luteolibacter sp. TaxID=1962973 RepID=UPI003267077D
MKPITQSIGVLAIALGCGAGGYFLGKNQSNTSSSVDQAGARIHREESHPSVPGRIGAPAVDPKALRAALDAEKNPLTRFKLALQNLEGWVAKDPKDALAWLASQQASDRRDDVIRMALNQYSDIDAKGAADWAMKNLSGNDLNNTLIAIAENWARENGAEAASWFLTLPVTPERDAAMENVLFNWASNEPAAALDFLKANPGIADLAPTLRRAALAGWAKSDPVGAVTSSLELSKANNDPDQFANTVANWATMDLQSSSQWLLAKLPPGAERTAAAQELATIYAQQSPEAGVAWLDQLATGAERDGAASALVATWSRISPAEAAKWAVSQNTGTLAPDAMAMIAQNYFMKNPNAFETWRAALPAGPMKEQASHIGGAGKDE